MNIENLCVNFFSDLDTTIELLTLVKTLFSILLIIVAGMIERSNPHKSTGLCPFLSTKLDTTLPREQCANYGLLTKGTWFERPRRREYYLLFLAIYFMN